jgi:hypothetical protein
MPTRARPSLRRSTLQACTCERTAAVTCALPRHAAQQLQRARAKASLAASGAPSCPLSWPVQARAQARCGAPWTAGCPTAPCLLCAQALPFTRVRPAVLPCAATCVARRRVTLELSTAEARAAFAARAACGPLRPLVLREERRCAPRRVCVGFRVRCVARTPRKLTCRRKPTPPCRDADSTHRLRSRCAGAVACLQWLPSTAMM